VPPGEPTGDGRNGPEGPRIHPGRQLLNITTEIYKVISQADRQASSAGRSLAMLNIKKLVDEIKRVAKTLYASDNDTVAPE
jgi:hypothetical protein